MTELGRDQQPEPWSEGAAGYETSFAPFTRLYADEALDLVEVGPGTRFLDVAAGSGTMSLGAAARGADVLATDFAPGMVELLARRFAASGYGSAQAVVMDGQALDLDDDTFDAAVSMLGLIFFPDLDAGFAELTRVTRPGGMIGVGTWRIAGFRLVELVSEALRRVVPTFEAPAAEPPWARVGTVDGLAAHLGAHGATDVAVHTLTRGWSFEDPARFFLELPSWSPPVQPMFEALPEATLGRAADAFAAVAGEAADERGELAVDVLFGTARAPASGGR